MPELRTPVMILIEASWEDQSGALQTIRARMENKSAGGACIRVKTPIAPGSKLRIRWHFEQFSSVVKYCRSEGREYLVGIQRDAKTTPTMSRSVPADVPPRQTGKNPDLRSDNPRNENPGNGEPRSDDPRHFNARNTELPVSQAKMEGLPQRQEIQPRLIAESQRKFDAPATRYGRSITPMPPLQVRRELAGRDIKSRDRSRSLHSQGFSAPRQTEIRTERTPKRKEADNERKNMGHKWLGLAPWRNKQEELSASIDENSSSKSEKENLMPQTIQPTEKAPVKSAREVPTFHVELLPVEDIYRAAGIMSPQRGYSVNKVVEMLNSDHIRGLSKEMRRAAVLMALDAAGISIDQVQRDAKARQDALESYEAEQKKQAEAEWARKAEEIIQIQSELESIKAHYSARISRNLEGVSRDKARFGNWVTTKQHETQSMAEAVELCLKSPVSEPARTPLPEASPAASAASANSKA